MKLDADVYLRAAQQECARETCCGAIVEVTGAEAHLDAFEDAFQPQSGDSEWYRAYWMDYYQDRLIPADEAAERRVLALLLMYWITKGGGL